mgnify:CR=1 FL=1
MAITPTRLIWMNGELKPWEEASVHVLTHALHYGSAVFEGVRCYATPEGPRLFRLKDHSQRLVQSGRVYRIDIPYTRDEIDAATKCVIAANGLNSAYVRPLAFRGFGSIGLVGEECPVETAIAAFPWGAYLGEDGIEKGIDVCVSSWQRVAPNTIPSGVKAAGNYMSSRLISMEARSRGFAEGIGLSTDGLVSEGAGENLFLIKDGTLITPPAAASILAGITRDTVITLAGELGIEVREQAIPREMLYLADEAFFTGTAAEITPIRSVDRLDVGTGERPVTKALQDAFYGLFTGATPDRWGWLEPVEQAAAVAMTAPAAQTVSAAE